MPERVPIRRDETLAVACTAEARARYVEAAASIDLPLSDWARRALDEAAERAFEAAEKEAARKRRAERARA